MADEAQLSFVVEHHEGRRFVRLRGEVDLVTAPLLAEVLEATNSEVVVDLADLTFMDGRGLELLADARARLQRHGDRLVVINAPGIAQRMLELTGLDDLLEGSDAP